jgi:hypothetical protein
MGGLCRRDIQKWLWLWNNFGVGLGEEDDVVGGFAGAAFAAEFGLRALVGLSGRKNCGEERRTTAELWEQRADAGRLGMYDASQLLFELLKLVGQLHLPSRLLRTLYIAPCVVVQVG